ncbi:auxin-responsive protein IAA27-like [Rutidosis leptorrhynchoides]|uniref:auxin-responsive protein IAA27-like n=1 Tax=Rutidosis leptorrhynchoides TaxID=125765 RepID=UPI003A995ECE
MSLSLKEHDYIGGSSQPKMEKTTTTHDQDLNFKATELRLGLPGSDLPERNLISGAKRGFSDTVNNPVKTWVFTASRVNFVKDGAFLSDNSNHNHNSVKDADKHTQRSASNGQDSLAASKAQVVGWPPIRSFRKNSMVVKHTKNEDDPNAEIGSNCIYVKVSMDGAPYLRKVDLKIYSSYSELSSALEKMFSTFTLGQQDAQGVSRREGLSESPLMGLLNGSEYVLTYEDKDGDLMLVGDVPWDMFISTCKRMRIMKSSDAIGLAPRAMEKCKNDN